LRGQPLSPALAAALLLLVNGMACSPRPEQEEAATPSPPAAAEAPAPGGGWMPIDPPAGPGAMAPSLTPSLTPAGTDLLLTWLEPAPPHPGAAPGKPQHSLRFARLTEDRWSAPVTVASGEGFFANWADFPAVAQAPDGSLTAHWLARLGEGTYSYGVYLARSTDGGATWTPAGLLHSDRHPAEHGFVAWAQEAGGLRAFWLDGRKTANDGPMALRTAHVETEPSQEEQVDPRVCDCCQTDAATTADGPVVVYRDRSDQEIRDISIVRKTAKGWSRPAPVHADHWEIHGCPVNGPAVAAAGQHLAVAWFTGAPPAPRVQIAFSEDGGATFGPPVVIDDKSPLGRVDLVLDPAGDALVSWLATQGRPDQGAAVQLRRVSAKGTAGAAAVPLGEVSAARSSGFPRLAIAGDRLYVAWVETGANQGPSRVRIGNLPLTSVP
jgi:hypothetical protein